MGICTADCDPFASLRIFEDGMIVRSCAEKELCVRCGLCCVAFVVDVPERVPVSVSDRMCSVRKRAGEVCPHLGIKGGFTSCACHDVRDGEQVHPHFVTCDGFDGGDPGEMFDDDGFDLSRSGYFGAVQATFAFLLEDPSECNILLVLDFCRKNIIQVDFYFNHIRAEGSEIKVLKLLKSILLRDELLWELTDKIHGLDEWLKQSGRLDRLALDVNNPVHEAFINRYSLNV